jgi:hypothetical protein
LKVYWDTSAINALVSKPVWDRLDTDEHFTRLHMFSEFFSIMTGRGIQIKGQSARLIMSAKDAATWLRKFSGKIKLAEMEPNEMLNAFDKASAKGVLGRLVYDYGHVLAAEKAGVGLILTRNTADFAPLTSKTVQWP